MSNRLNMASAAWRQKHAAIHKSVRGCRWSISVCLAFLAASAVAQPSVEPATEAAKRYPAGAIHSVSDADDALDVVARERAAIESRYTEEERECHPKFFATSCIERAKERRRKATMELRAVENEANVYKRRARVEERDKAVEEKRLQAETDRMDRIRLPKEADHPGTQQAPQEKPLQSVETGTVKPLASPSPGRKERHQEKLNRLQVEEAAKAGERAEKVAKYEKKVQAAKARQQEVAAKKAEKEQKRRLKEARTAETKK